MAKTLRERLGDMWRHGEPRRQPAPAEPDQAIQEALTRLRRLASAGVVVPSNLTVAVLVAQQELLAGAGTISLQTGSNLYDASYKLAILAARLIDEGDVPLADAFSRAVVNSENMLKFASESGTTVPPEVQAALVAGQVQMDTQCLAAAPIVSAPIDTGPVVPASDVAGRVALAPDGAAPVEAGPVVGAHDVVGPIVAAPNAGAVDAGAADMRTALIQTKVRFFTAYAVLAKLLGNVTADTIKACRSPRTRRALKNDETRAITLALVTVVLSVLLFTAAAIDKQLLDEIGTANDLAIKLRGNVFPPGLSDKPPAAVPPEYVSEPCSALTVPPKPGDFIVKSQADLDQIQSFAIAVRDARSRANKLNFFILTSECDPFGYCWWWNGAHNKTVATMLAPGFKPAIRDRFELNPALSNYTAELLCKVQTWQEIRSFASNIEKSYAATSGGVVAYALPILYALLGAYAYRLRQFSETVRNRTFHPSFADSARLITALIAGAVAGLFNPARDLSVSPLATAFLVGYGVEIFFRFLDTTLSAYSSAAPGTATVPQPQATVIIQQPAGDGREPAPRPEAVVGQAAVGRASSGDEVGGRSQSSSGGG